MPFIVAIDGPAGSGKGTAAKIVAKKCNLKYLDTGITYRACAYKTILEGVHLEDEGRITSIANNLDLQIFDTEVFLDDKNVTREIRSNEVNKIVSYLSNIIPVRYAMNEIQRNVLGDEDVIVEGRDTTTVLFPNADVKIYLDASLAERARRRKAQNIELGIKSDYEDIRENLRLRDDNDKTKPFGALVRTNDQIYIDTDNMSIDEVADQIIDIIESVKK